MWPVKNSHDPARMPCAYSISVPPILVGAIHFTSAIAVFLHTKRIVVAALQAGCGLHAAATASRSIAPARRQKRQQLMKVLSLTPACGNLTVLQPSCSCCPPEAE